MNSRFPVYGNPRRASLPRAGGAVGKRLRELAGEFRAAMAAGRYRAARQLAERA
ncbi:hypothetical protein QHI69_34320 [Burkholderia gladioli pv. gladioli]|nr:hypothetical protein [Burkholderia gladioli]MDJ1166993.1 hypothetical protein [Burkholderia gladioli pv. gladioli]